MKHLLLILSLVLMTFGLKAQEGKGVIAILPFTYIIDRQDAGEAMTYEVQNEVFSKLNGHSGTWKLQDPTTTNAKLFKAGINESTVRGFTPDEICQALGVEYIIRGSVQQNATSASTSSSSSDSYKTSSGSSSNSDYRSNNNKNSSSKGTDHASSYSTSKQNYSTNVTMTINNDKGETVFTQSHESTWSSLDAYKNTILFLLKKTPVYVKK